MSARPAVIALMGPTASGKTAAGIALAQRLDGEVISVDSALVYRGLDIGAAKPDLAERAGIPHHLIDLREPWQPYSAADFARDAERLIVDIAGRGRLPILVGGTGLYFRALLDGLSPMPESDPDTRATLQTELHERGIAALHQELQRIDPLAAQRIRPTDPQRILRAIEVFRVSGRALSTWQSEQGRRVRPFRCLKLVLAPDDRSLLHQRIELRFEQMLAQGLIDEVRALRTEPRNHADLPAMRAVGYRQVWQALDAPALLPELKARGVAATRQLAKRQLTWLRSELDAFWVNPLTEAERLLSRVGDFLRH
ncbi:tRNA (adenosine(37)-N6)-dimethylallyltransferase MiaA [Pseudomarimonas arenosa]|uniref:tRNA dimethylallyltransferase n=1 Tax=Pseudomarimonas arenosa TaxID=2774145 RepID=A0AAW3ZM81_9GAMM|nr:tRNA (adenosine(37)-N6)-dimethylallyltransferase MiaA [Pseudomarimonas arenosa]MBD8527235.1 tRNA (adenosine(37)-N6)-dimethylallyltransferase MiaA [Pseudomarimonas arenosa]